MPYDKNGKAGELAAKTELAWFNKGTNETPTPIKNTAANTPKRFLKHLEDTIKQDERYHLDFAWYGDTDGHIVAIERDNNGELMIYDPQDGTIKQDRELRNYLRRFSYAPDDSPRLLRVDNLDFNKEYAGEVVKGTL